MRVSWIPANHVAQHRIVEILCGAASTTALPV